MTDPLRLLLFDSTAGALTVSWRAGAVLYRALGRIDASHGAATWDDGLSWLATFAKDRKISEIQYWGHGQPGCLLLDRRPLDLSALDAGHALRPSLEAIRTRLIGPEALWWFRTCSTFHGDRGHAFAQGWTTFFGARAAGHTRVIGPLQGGLHSLRPGEAPAWSIRDGARRSRVPQWATTDARTITCLGGRVPDGW